MEEKIIGLMNEQLQDYGLTQDDLTAEELKELREECELIANGKWILDGILSVKGFDIFLRKQSKAE